MRNRFWVVLAFTSVFLAACGKEAATPDESSDVATPVAETASDEQLAVEIDAEYMRAIVKEISDDKYEGRGPGTRGDEAARQYLIDTMTELGLQPAAADGGWQQTFDLVGINSAQPDSWTFATDNDSLTLKQWDQFIVGSGIQEELSTIDNAELVFVGYGIQAPEYDWDDYKGVDLSGKVLVMMNNDPDWDPDLFAGDTRLWYGRWDYKYLSAARQGAVGAIIIHTDKSAGYPFQVVQTSWTGEQFQLPAGDEPRSDIAAWVTEDSARELVALAGMDLDELRERADNRDFEPVPLGITTSLSVPNTLTRVETANVLGIIPGSDPELADEVVIYTAHHDHLGIGTPNEEGDNIYNGARDNGSGVALIMAVAKAMVALPEAPRRSTLFAFVGAEEQGLLGSKFYAENPTFPAGKIAANLNYDSVNIWGHSHDVTYVGLGKSNIDTVLREFTDAQDRVIKPDQFSDKGYFYRSDQFSFAKIGVPAMYLKAGTDFVDRPAEWGREQQNKHTEEDYHQPTDEYDDSWNFDGMVDDALLGYLTGLSIANADEMPRWNEGDEFEAARLKALEAVREED